jgi:2-keto-3-deoxy-L-fuconate dehydrogenase
VGDRLKGKLALVTAAGQGIDRAIAEAFTAQGAKVIATDLDAAKLKDLKKAKVFALDVRDTGEVDALAKNIIKQFGAPDILVNCAGYVHQGSVLDCSEQDWNFLFDLNVKSMHRMLRAFIPAMLQNGGGAIVNISSAVSSIRGVPSRYAYGATKAAVDWTDQGGRRRFHPARAARQCDLPRHHPVAVARRPHRGGREADR